VCLSVVIDGVCLSSNTRITYLLTYLLKKLELCFIVFELEYSKIEKNI